ncbi:MAG: 30S ribosomal protein S7 [Patescibacteria group bacterium]|nr:MAG: 30S ribosomal protein S7 [Patescibacteria group bacterium]
MRGKRAKRRQAVGDFVLKSKVLNRMINVVMLNGKKSVAEAVVYGAIGRLNEDRKEGLRMFEQAIKNVMPQQEVRSRRVGGATYQVPMPLKHERAEALAIRWIVNSARSKKGKPMVEKLYEELNNAYQGVGDAIKKRDDTHKMAEANRAFAHFARS